MLPLNDARARARARARYCADLWLCINLYSFFSFRIKMYTRHTCCKRWAVFSLKVCFRWLLIVLSTDLLHRSLPHKQGSRCALGRGLLNPPTFPSWPPIYRKKLCMGGAFFNLPYNNLCFNLPNLIFEPDHLKIFFLHLTFDLLFSVVSLRWWWFIWYILLLSISMACSSLVSRK